MYQYSIIPQAKQKITETLKQLKLSILDKNFTVEKNIQNTKRFFMPICADKQGKKYFFKARFQNTDELFLALKKEIEFNKNISPIISSKNPHFITPGIIKSGRDKQGYIWFYRECYEENFAGFMDVDSGMTKEFLDKCSPQDFALKLFSLQKNTFKIKKTMQLHSHNYHWYKADFDYYFYTEILQKEIPRELKKIKQLFEKNKILLNRNANWLTHGDLYPNNILISNNQLVIIDWELVHLNNQAFDLIFIWMNAFRNPKWQQDFLKTYFQKIKNKINFQKLFRIVGLTLCLRFFHHDCVIIKTFNKGYKEKLISRGFTEKQIHGTLKKAREAKKAHFEILKKLLKQNKFILRFTR
ncbi:MAG: phosphotransferase [Patescibacteria group bacterium]